MVYTSSALTTRATLPTADSLSIRSKALKKDMHTVHVLYTRVSNIRKRCTEETYVDYAGAVQGSDSLCEQVCHRASDVAYG